MSEETDVRRMVVIGAQNLGDLVGYLPCDVVPALGHPVMLQDAVRSVAVQGRTATELKYVPLPRATQPVDVEVVPLVWYELTGKDRSDNESRIKAEVGEFAAKNAGLSVVRGSIPQHNGGRPAHVGR